MSQQPNEEQQLTMPPINMNENTNTNSANNATQNIEIETNDDNDNENNNTNMTQNRAALHSQNIIENTTTDTVEENEQSYSYGPVTSNELLPIIMALKLMYTTQRIPDVLELPTKFITNMQQYEASQANSGPKCASQIPPYHANRLVHHLLGTNPSQANNEYLYQWFPQYVNTNPMVFNDLVIIKKQWLQYNKLVKMGRKQGPTMQAITKVIRHTTN